MSVANCLNMLSIVKLSVIVLRNALLCNVKLTALSSVVI
jgi:hypothetical protein